jgi:uncharacterized protein (DUF433 family)
LALAGLAHPIPPIPRLGLLHLKAAVCAPGVGGPRAMIGYQGRLPMPSAQPILTYPHIEIGPNGVPLLAGTTMKVVELVMAQQAYGWSPEEIHFQHPDLPLSQIYSAFAYYWDHKQELDADIERRSQFVEQMRREIGASALAETLKARGRHA